jgi:hypothetical protein
LLTASDISQIISQIMAQKQDCSFFSFPKKAQRHSVCRMFCPLRRLSGFGPQERKLVRVVLDLLVDAHPC